MCRGNGGKTAFLPPKSLRYCCRAMLRRSALILLLVLAACATAPRPLPQGDVGAEAEPLDPSIKPLVQEQEEQAG